MTIANTTVEKRGAHTVSLKTTGHEKAKITVCLTACANGDKQKPFFLFKGAKREVKRLNEEFRTQCVVATSASGWMTEELTEQYILEVLGVFTFGKRRLLVWDSFHSFIHCFRQLLLTIFCNVDLWTEKFTSCLQKKQRCRISSGN